MRDRDFSWTTISDIVHHSVGACDMLPSNLPNLASTRVGVAVPGCLRVEIEGIIFSACSGVVGFSTDLCYSLHIFVLFFLSILFNFIFLFYNITNLFDDRT